MTKIHLEEENVTLGATFDFIDSFNTLGLIFDTLASNDISTGNRRGRKSLT